MLLGRKNNNTPLKWERRLSLGPLYLL